MKIGEIIYSILTFLVGVGSLVFWIVQIAEDPLIVYDPVGFFFMLLLIALMIGPSLAVIVTTIINAGSGRLREWPTGLQAPALILTCWGLPLGIVAYVLYRRIRKRRYLGLPDDRNSDEESYHRPREDDA